MTNPLILKDLGSVLCSVLDFYKRQVMKYLIRLGVEGLKRVLTNNAFSESEKVTNELRDYEIQNNPIMPVSYTHLDVYKRQMQSW